MVSYCTILNCAYLQLQLGENVQTAFQLAFGALGTILFGILAHKKIGKYPKPLPKSQNPKKELFEIIALWSIVFASISYIILFGSEAYPTITIGGVKFTLHFLFILFTPFLLEMVINRRSLKELGFITPISWKPAIALIGFGLFFGIFAFLFEGATPVNKEYLLLGIITPSFKEEWFYRAILQLKLERVFGLNNRWFYGGVLFGLAHVPTTFYGPLWVACGNDILGALFRLLGHCAFGWLWGILFIKCRSIIPGSIGHYFADYFPGIMYLLGRI